MRDTAAGPIRHRLACLVTAVVATAAIGFLVAPAASAEGCAWQRHSKRIVKHLKRHGRMRPVKRVKRWWTCDAQPTAFTPAPALPVLPPPDAAPPADEPRPQVSHLGIKAVEWSYTLTRPEVAAGSVTIELNNQGEDAHNLKLQLEGSEEPPLEVPEASAGGITSASFTLPPGSYHLYCSLFHHDEKGMHATLVVGNAP